METEIKLMTKLIKDTEKSKDVEEAMDLAKYFAWKVIEGNATGRATERAIIKVCGEEKFAEVMKVALQERIAGDEFTKKERKFCEEFFTDVD